MKMLKILKLDQFQKLWKNSLKSYLLPYGISQILESAAVSGIVEYMVI